MRPIHPKESATYENVGITQKDIELVFRQSRLVDQNDDFQVVHFRPIGTGQMAETFRCEYIISSAPHTLRSCVVKLPILENRVSGDTRYARAYDRERRFYQDLHPEISGVSSPQFHGAFTLDGQTAIVLEEVEGAMQGDQITGAGPNQVELPVAQLAKLQARWWGDEVFGSEAWLYRLVGRPIPDVQERYQKAWSNVSGDVRADLSSRAVKVIEEFGDRCDEWSRKYEGPYTLVHHDYRLDNMLFSDGSVWILDWQTLGWGSPSWDLAYFAGSSLVTDRRRQLDRLLVEKHAGQLRDAGVTSWNDDDAWDGYRAMAYSPLLITVPAAGELKMNPRARDMFVAIWNRTAQMIMDLDSNEFL